MILRLLTDSLAVYWSVMPNRCVAPGCNPEKGVKKSYFHFPCNANLSKIWQCAVPRSNWKPTAHSVLCEDHFLETDFINEHTNNWRRRKGNERCRKTLKSTAVPTQWPNCPPHLSKPVPPPRSEKCRQRSSHIDKNKTNINIKKTTNSLTITSLEDLDKNWDSGVKNYPITKGDGFRIISSLDVTNPTVIQYCVTIFAALDFQLWCNGLVVNKSDLVWLVTNQALT